MLEGCHCTFAKVLCDAICLKACFVYSHHGRDGPLRSSHNNRLRLLYSAEFTFCGIQSVIIACVEDMTSVTLTATPYCCCYTIR